MTATADTTRAARRQIRLLCVSSDTYPPTRVDVAVLFGQELAQRGHRIDWILQSEAACSHAYETDWHRSRVWVGPTALEPTLVRRILKHVRGIVHDLWLFRLLRGGRYDGILVKDKFLSGLFAVIAAKLYRRKFIYWLSYPFPEEYLLRSRDKGERYARLYAIRGIVFRYLLYNVLLPRADHVFVQSEQMRRDVAREGINASRMTAVPMGVAMDPSADIPAAAPRSAVATPGPCFLYLGTLARVRHMDFLIRVLALVVREIPDVRLYVVGRGNEPADEQLLVDEARRLNVVRSLVMVGHLPQAQALQYVRDADVCVSPFFPTPILNSTSPTKLIEYMAQGKPVVANDHPEQRLVIDASGGGYCVPYAEQPFADAVCRLLRQPEAARAMGAKGWQYVAQHRTYGTIADAVERDLQRAIGKPS